MNSRPNEIFAGNVLLLRELCIPVEIISHVVTNFDPSLINIPAGSIKLTCTRGRNQTTVEELLSYESNLVGDVLFWSTLSSKGREHLVTYSENVALPPDEVATKNRFVGSQKYGVVICTYIMHGSLHGLAYDKPTFPGFALSATKMLAEDFHIDKIASFRSFASARLPTVVMDFGKNIQFLPQTMKLRFNLTFTSNRVFVILKLIMPVMSENTVVPPVIAHMIQDDIKAAAPYYSFHPDHPANPMRDCSKMIYSMIGSLLGNSPERLAPLFEKCPRIFLKSIRECMLTRPEDNTSAAPDLARMVAATKPAFSIRVMAERT